MKSFLKNKGLLKLQATEVQNGFIVECTGALAGTIHYNPDGRVTLIESLGGSIMENVMLDLSDTLRSIFQTLVARSLFISLDSLGRLQAYDNISFEKSETKAKFISEDEVEGDELLMDFLILLNFV